MKMDRCCIYIDGSNFYYKLKELGFHNQLKFNYIGFLKYLARKNNIIETKYYIGKVRTGKSKKSKKMHADQQKLFAVLKKNEITYSLGYLLKSDGKYHEKGVDVQIAVDLLVASYENKCNRMILVSSDTDLIPAIKQAKKNKKEVEYIGFSHMPSLALIANCDISRLLTKEDLSQFT